MRLAGIATLLVLMLTPGWAASRSDAGRMTEVSLTDDALILSGVQASSVRHRNTNARMLMVSPPNAADDATFAALRSITARDFVVEAVLKGVPVDLSSTARGFVGIAFRISDDLKQFEAIYLRPTNARADDQVRRNHTAQYISHPGYPWERLRAEYPGKYESYVDLNSERWTKIRLVVNGSSARLYVDGAAQPALIVNDLKLPRISGSIGLWVGPGSKGYFKSLKVAVTRP